MHWRISIQLSRLLSISMCIIDKNRENRRIFRRFSFSNILFKPLLHGQSAFFCHGECINVLHLTLLVAERSVPVLAGDGTLVKVHFLGCSHDHIGFCPEPEIPAGTGENIVHGKGVQSRNKDFLAHSLTPVSSSISSSSSSKSFSASLTGSGLVISTPAPFSRSMGVLEQPPDRKLR